MVWGPSSIGSISYFGLEMNTIWIPRLLWSWWVDHNPKLYLISEGGAEKMKKIGESIEKFKESNLMASNVGGNEKLCNGYGESWQQIIEKIERIQSFLGLTKKLVKEERDSKFFEPLLYTAPLVFDVHFNHRIGICRPWRLFGIDFISYRQHKNTCDIPLHIPIHPIKVIFLLFY